MNNQNKYPALYNTYTELYIYIHREFYSVIQKNETFRKPIKPGNTEVAQT